MRRHDEDRPQPELSAFTPDARKAVDQATADFRKSLIELSRRSQQARPNPLPEVTEFDVNAALRELGFALNEASADNQVRFNISAYRRALLYGAAISTLLGTLGGYGVYALSSGLDNADLVSSVVGTATGLTGLATAGYAIYSSMRAREMAQNHKRTATSLAKNAARETAIIMGWAELEHALQEYFGDTSQSAPRNLSKLILAYSSEANLSASEIIELKDILRLRNLLTHSPADVLLPDWDAERYESQIAHHLKKIRSTGARKE
ncbi:hypothetical protein [Actinomadura sp. NPDC049753]|uniref:hypothetical protein n=1 Tax=Actinomadura sp. NPDC049753 TaxID=3154739 RepID=UPI00343DD9A7